MARDGFLILDSDLHMMEPDDLWARYLEGPHRATARSPRRWSSSSGCRSAPRSAARSSGTTAPAFTQSRPRRPPRALPPPNLEVQMADKIRVGIVGATVTQGGSGWGANAHVPALKALPHYELKAVCTAHEDTAKASAAAFGAERAFHRFSDMAAHPDVDLIVVCVRVPGHRDLVMAGLQAGKPVFCEWPLGANLAEAEEMAGLASQRSVKTIVGLQARSDPTILYARDLVQGGYIGEVLTAHLNAAVPAVLQRGPGRIWQGVRANGANTLTIAGGHAIDAMCAILGEFAEVSARV